MFILVDNVTFNYVELIQFLCLLIQILDVNGTGKSIAVDWIGRDLYWIEEESLGKYAIKSYDLNRNNRHSNTIMQRAHSVGKVAVNPYAR